jgi:hypothetical protein
MILKLFSFPERRSMQLTIDQTWHRDHQCNVSSFEGHRSSKLIGRHEENNTTSTVAPFFNNDLIFTPIGLTNVTFPSWSRVSETLSRTMFYIDWHDVQFLTPIPRMYFSVSRSPDVPYTKSIVWVFWIISLGTLFHVSINEFIHCRHSRSRVRYASSKFWRCRRFSKVCRQIYQYAQLSLVSIKDELEANLCLVSVLLLCGMESSRASDHRSVEIIQLRPAEESDT